MAFNPRRQYVVSSRLSQVTPFIAIAQLNFIKESTSYIHNTVLGISNTTDFYIGMCFYNHVPIVSYRI